MGAHCKIQFSGGVHKNQYIGGNCLKMGVGLGQFVSLRGGLAKKRGEVVIPQCTQCLLDGLLI